MRKALLSMALLGFFVTPGLAAPDAAAVVAHYTDLAEAIYGDSHLAARKLETAIDVFLAHPTPETLAAARIAWKAARVPYLQS